MQLAFGLFNFVEEKKKKKKSSNGTQQIEKIIKQIILG